MKTLILSLALLLIPAAGWAGQFDGVSHEAVLEANHLYAVKINELTGCDVQKLLPQNYAVDKPKSKSLYKMRLPKSPGGILVSLVLPGLPMMLMNAEEVGGYEVNDFGTFIFIYGLISKWMYFSVSGQPGYIGTMKLFGDIILIGGNLSVTAMSISYCW